MLIQLPPPLPPNPALATEKNLAITNNDPAIPKGVTPTNSELELHLDVVMDIGRYSTNLGHLGLPETASPLPMPLRVGVEERLGKQKEREKEKIQEYYLSSSSSVSTGSPSSPFERYGMETETDLSSPDTPYPGGILDVINTHPLVRKRSSFFGWEFAWDQEALERADDTEKLRGSGSTGPSPVRWKSGAKFKHTSNPSTPHHKKIQPLQRFMDLGGDQEPSLSRPHSLSSVGGGKIKRGMSWSSVCGAVGVKGKSTLGLGIGMKPLRLTRSFGGSSHNGGGGHGSGTGNAREIGHRTIFSGDVGPMCGLSLKRKATALMCRQKRSVSGPEVSAVSSRQGDATKITIAPKKKTKPGHSTTTLGDGISPSVESEIGERNSNIDNHSMRNLDSDEELDADEDADVQKTPTVKSRTTTRSYSHSPQSYRYSPLNQQTATSESHCGSINESCISITTTTTATNSPQKVSPSLTRRGLSLKRSFKMGSTVGRTLGPGLTLSSAGLNAASASRPCASKSIRRCESEGFGFREEAEKCHKREEKEKREKKGSMNLGDDDGKEDDEDVDVKIDMRSVRLVSASCVSATPASVCVGVDFDFDVGGGLASKSSGSDGPVKYRTIPKSSMLHSRPSLPIMNTTTAASVTVCSTVTDQHQDQHDEQNPVLLTATSCGYDEHAWKPHHSSVDLFRSETSDSRINGDISPEQIMSRGKDNDRLSSLPILPPLPPLLLSPPLPSSTQSQSLPLTPTKSRSSILSKTSISSFKKQSAPPALPPVPRSLDWPHSMSTKNAAAVSMVSLTHSRSHSGSQSVAESGQGQGKTNSKSLLQTPRPSMRLSAMNMGTMRSAFAGVGAKVSARMSVNNATTRGGVSAGTGNAAASSLDVSMGVDDGDFMDLRDPFAPPPPSKLVSVFRTGDHIGGGGGDFWVSERAMSSLGGGDTAGYDDEDSVEVGITRRMGNMSGGKRRMNMNAWGRLPIPSTLPVLGSAPGTSSASVSSLVAARKKAHSHHGERKKHKEKRARLGELDSSELNVPCSGYNACEEDADFDIEEALLAQRLLRRLDSVEWD